MLPRSRTYVLLIGMANAAVFRTAAERYTSTRMALMSSTRIAFVICGLMLAGSIGAILARPEMKVARQLTPISLQTMIPKKFGDWHEEMVTQLQVVNPETKALLDKLYSEVLDRVYVNGAGYRIMLSIAYGTDQHGSMQVHKPEVCYPAQGFTVEKSGAARLETIYGTIPVRRLYTVRAPRSEPVTYWFTVGDEAVQEGLQRRLADLRYGLTGRIPDGLLFRVSSIDRDQSRAYRNQDEFVGELLNAVSPLDRERLSGLRAPAAATASTTPGSAR